MPPKYIEATYDMMLEYYYPRLSAHFNPRKLDDAKYIFYILFTRDVTISNISNVSLLYNQSYDLINDYINYIISQMQVRSITKSNQIDYVTGMCHALFRIRNKMKPKNEKT